MTFRFNLLSPEATDKLLVRRLLFAVNSAFVFCTHNIVSPWTPLKPVQSGGHARFSTHINHYYSLPTMNHSWTTHMYEPFIHHYYHSPFTNNYQPWIITKHPVAIWTNINIHQPIHQFFTRFFHVKLHLSTCPWWIHRVPPGRPERCLAPVSAFGAAGSAVGRQCRGGRSSWEPHEPLNEFNHD